jgi:hypothetical protein
MKNIKIGIFVGFIVLIGFVIIKLGGGTGTGGWTGDEGTTDGPEEFISRIQNKIDSLKTVPEEKLSQNFYDAIKIDINNAANAGKFGSNEQENRENREILEKNLYSAYAEKFVAQAMYIFKRSEWKQTDILQLRSGVKDLSASPHLKPGPVANSFTTIKGIITKHDEITAFVNSCKSFTASPDQPESGFPDVTDKITRAQQYLTGNLENPFVNNCQRLKEELTNVPKFLADNNYNYLFKKIEIQGGRYTELSEEEYAKGPRKYLRIEINSFERKVRDYNRAETLSNKLDTIEFLAKKFYDNKK